MAAYAVVDVDIFDIAEYMHYQQAVRPLLDSAQARYLVRGGELHVIQGDVEPQRLIIVEFPSMDDLLDFYNSDSYQALETQRETCSRATVIAVRGVEDALTHQD
ncbi:MAG: DUF1330 domain-containing protein [Halioglobus sp.]